MKRRIITLLFFIIAMIKSYAQDPVFSQFFSSPLNINPALTANINSDWRAMSNYRSQWLGITSPFVTATVSYDSKILAKGKGLDGKSNYLGVGGMLMFDKAMGGVAKATFASLNFSYNIKLIDGSNNHRLGVGFGGSYGRRSVDYSQLDFQDQFTGFGFNTNLPTGEIALSNMKAFISANTGLTYSITSDKSNVDIGVAAFHVNRPRQTFLKDVNQRLAVRKVAHANFETFINERIVLNTNAIYQLQSNTSTSAKYLSAGGGLGYFLGNDKGPIINAGLWYWAENGLVPYMGLVYNNLQFGLTYEMNTSKLGAGARKPASVELSIILRGSREPSKSIACPWK